MKELWEERYATEDYVYGKEPNQFFKEQLEKITPARILMFADGEGRNGVYAARQGWSVESVDLSEKAKEKALLLAKENNVTIKFDVADLVNFTAQNDSFDAIGIFFLHLPDNIAEIVMAKAVAFLKPGGKLIIEVYEKEQIGRDSGGPNNVDLLYSLEDFVNYFNALDFDLFRKEYVNLSEGSVHQGEACVIRFVGTKPLQ